MIERIFREVFVEELKLNSKLVTLVLRWRHRRDKTEVVAAELIGRKERISLRMASGSELNRSSSWLFNLLHSLLPLIIVVDVQDLIHFCLEANLRGGREIGR